MSPDSKRPRRRADTPTRKAVPISAGSKPSYTTTKFMWSPKFVCLDDENFGFHLVKHGELWFDVLSKLQDFSTMTWQKILDATGGRRNGNNNHFLDPKTALTTRGWNAWNRRSEDEKSMELFSLRTAGQKRIIGFRDGSIFHVIWRDNDHDFARTSQNQ